MRGALLVVLSLGCSGNVVNTPPAGDATTAADTNEIVDASRDADASAEVDVEADAGPEPRTLAEVPNAAILTVDSAIVYVATSDDSLVRVPATGGSPTRIATAVRALSLATDDRYVYWMMGARLTVPPNPGAVMRVSIDGALDGGVPEILTPIGLTNPTNLALAGATLFFANNLPEGTIYSVPGAGGTTATLATTPRPQKVAASAGHVCWIAEDVAVECLDGTVKRLVTETANVRAIVVDATHAFYATDTGVLRRIPLAGGTPVTIDSVSGPTTYWPTIALDASHAYWGMDSEVRRAAKTGTSGALVWRESAGSQVTSIALDATNMYWILDQVGDAKIRSLPKP